MRGIMEKCRYAELAAVLLVVIGCGCGTQKVVIPQVEGTAKADFRILGKILYDGRPEYLPATVGGDNAAVSRLVIKYTYRTAYGRDNIHQALPLFNPLTAIGFPIGGNTLMIGATLEIHREDKLIKSYTSTCAFDVTRNLFYEGDTYTELRKEGLLEVKRNIETQMFLDREYLASVKFPE